MISGKFARLLPVKEELYWSIAIKAFTEDHSLSQLLWSALGIVQKELSVQLQRADIFILDTHCLSQSGHKKRDTASMHKISWNVISGWTNLADTAYLDAMEIDSVRASVNAATRWTTHAEWRCNGCNTPDKKMRECWECGAWECKACSFWCTTCRKGDHQYTICGHCHAQGIYLKRAGKIWRCSWCEQRTRWSEPHKNLCMVT